VGGRPRGNRRRGRDRAVAAFAALEDVVREVAGDELADHYRGGPWGMPYADHLRELLEESGFDHVRVT
jgi:hypothetical protein